MANPTLFQWGKIQFQIWPLNFHEYDHMTATDYAKKEVMESIPQREWVGEGNEEIQIRGKVFTQMPTPRNGLGVGASSGFAELEAFEQARKEGQAHQLIRGNMPTGQVLGWFVCERLVRSHKHLDVNGVGRLIEFEALFARCDTPDPASYISDILPRNQG